MKIFEFIRKFGWLASGAAAVTAPVAIVIACGSATPNSATEVQISQDNLSKVRVTGDTRNIKFEVPRELTHVDGSALSATGATQAFDVYGRTGLALGSGKVENSELNNFNFMPLPLLEAYMGQRLSYVNNRLVVTSGATQLDVLTTYGSLFGFTTKNVIAPRLFGAWSKTEFFLKYVARPGYTAPTATLNTEVPINFAATENALATYVNLDLTYLTATEQNEFTEAFGYTATSVQSNVTWTSLTPKLPASLESYVASATYVADDGAPSATLPTSFTYEPAARSLIANLTPRPGFVLSAPRLNITAIARINAIPTLLDDSPEYSALDLSKVVLTIANNKITLDQTGVTLPRGAKIQLRLDGGPWVDSVALLLATLPTTASTSFDNMRVRLAGTILDGAIYVVGDDKETKLASTQGVTIVKTAAFFDAAAAMNIDANNSTPTALQWTNVPAVPAELASAVLRPEYLLGDFVNADAADASETWSASVPAQLPLADLMKARLWTRLVPNPSYFLVPALADLTTSSKLDQFIAEQTFEDVSNLVQQADALLLEPNSTHDALQWNKPQGVTIPAALTNAVARVEYLSGDYSSITAATTAPANAWQASLPSLLDASHAKRFLWVRFVPREGVRLSTILVDITTSSQVQEVRTRIDVLPAYQDFTVKGVKIAVTPANQIAASTPPLPLGTTLQYRYGASGAWGPLGTIESALLTISSYDASAIMVRLFNADPNRYVLTSDKMGAPDLTGLVGTLDLTKFFTALEALQVDVATSTSRALVWQNAPALNASEAAGVAKLEWIIGAYASGAEIPATAVWSATLPTSFSPPLSPRNLWVRATAQPGYFVKSELSKGLFTTSTLLDQVAIGVDTSSFVTLANALRVDPASTHDALIFTDAPAVPADLTEAVAGIEYLSGNFPTLASASAASAWSDALPASTVFEAASRYLYVRLVARPGFALSQSVFDLTASSAIRAVRAKVDTQPGYAALDLSLITLTGSLLAATLDEKAVTFPVGAVLRYQITPTALGASGWLTAAALTAYLNTNLEQITASDFATVRAHFEASDGARYVIVDDRAASVDVTSFQRLIDVDLTASYNAALANALVVSTAARHNALTWANAAPATPTAVSTVEFLTGNFSSVASASVATTWTSTLPISVDYTPTNRYFWARLTPSRGYNLTSPTLLNLTTSSKIQDVVSTIDVSAAYQALDLTKVKITGFLFEVKFNLEAVILPYPAHLEYQINTPQGYSDWMAENAFATYLQTNYDAISDSNLQEINARLVNDDLVRYELLNEKVTKIDASELRRDGVIDVAALVAAFSAMRPAPGATNENATWINAVAARLGVEIAYAADPKPEDLIAPAEISPIVWTSTPPTSFTNDKTVMSLWAQLVASKGYLLPDSITGHEDATYYVFDSNKRAVLDVTDFTAARTMTSLIDASLLAQFMTFANTTSRIALARRAGNQTYSKWIPANSSALPAFLRTVAGTVRYFQANSTAVSGNSFTTAAGVHNFGVSQNWNSTYFWITPPAEYLLNANFILRTAWILLDLNENYAVKGRTERYFYVSKITQVQSI